MKNCKKFKVLIYKKIDGIISDSQDKKLENHIKICPSCQKEYEFSKNLINSLNNEKEVDLPSNFKEDLHKKLVEENIKTEEKKIFFGKFPIGITATACIAAFLMIFTLSSDIDKTYNNLSDELQHQTIQEDVNNNEKATTENNTDIATQKNHRAINPEVSSNNISSTDEKNIMESKDEMISDEQNEISNYGIEAASIDSYISSNEALKIAVNTLNKDTIKSLDIDNPRVEEIVFNEKPSIFIYDENYDVTGRTLYKITFNSLNEILGPLITYVDKENGKFIGHNIRN